MPPHKAPVGQTNNGSMPATDSKKVKEVQYTDIERTTRNSWIKRLCKMRDDRDQSHPELDGMTYLEYYDSNRKKDLSFIPPKKNKQDVRIVTGMTREKDTTLLSTLLNMNLEPNISAFDKDDLVVAELGNNMGDLVKKSREIENWGKKRPIVYRELISQGDTFIEEINVDKFKPMPVSKIDWDPTKNKISELNFTERLKKIYQDCSSRMIDGRKVYLGSMKIEYVEDQDVVAICNVYKRATAEAIYSKWERWENVPSTVDTLDVFTDEGGTYKNWNLVQAREDEVVEIKVMDQEKNRLQIFLNGVMMLPHNYPLSAISPTGEIPMAQGKLEPISGFAYSKSQPAKSKVDQEVLDEMTVLMVEAVRQMRKPPMGVRGKKVYSPSIFLAGKITNDVNKDELFPLLPDGNRGISQGEFNFFNLIKESINDKTTNEVYSGNTPNGDPTATEVVQQKEQQMLKLALAMDGVVNLEKRMTWNRLQNILKNWTKPIDEDIDETRNSIYRTISVETTLDNGETGVKIFRMTTGQYPEVTDQEQEENDLGKQYRKPVRVVYLDPEMLRMTKYYWYIIITPTPKSNDKLARLIFSQNLREAIELFGYEALNFDYLKQRYAIVNEEDYGKMFKQMDVMTMLQQGMGPNGMPANGGGAQPGNRQVGIKDTTGTSGPLRPAIK